MAKFKGTFKRYEKKYLMNFEQCLALMQVFQKYMAVDEYGKTTICNIYFDTPDFLLIQRSIEKPTTYKEKLRLRTYGIPTYDSTAFIELKKKFKKIVYKRRISADLTSAMGYLYNRSNTIADSQIKKEIDYTFDLYKGLQPAMLLSYERIAMYGLSDPEFRITVDRNIRWRTEDLDLTKGAYGRPVLYANQYLMEIKIIGAMPLWLSSELSRLKIFPTSFSKYGQAYKSYMTLCRKKGARTNAG